MGNELGSTKAIKRHLKYRQFSQFAILELAMKSESREHNQLPINSAKPDLNGAIKPPEAGRFQESMHESEAAQALEKKASQNASGSAARQSDVSMSAPHVPAATAPGNEPPLPASQQPASSQPSMAAEYTQTGTSSSMPKIADDTDLIEKEWVDKAKEIVSKTAHDPYLQNQEITKMKAEYLKKRYNKVLDQGD